jgi:allophanate hydrolase subunit 2
VDWIGLVQDWGRWRALDFGIEPSGSINAGKRSSVLTTRDLSSSAQLHGVS